MSVRVACVQGDKIRLVASRAVGEFKRIHLCAHTVVAESWQTRSLN